MNKRKGLIRLFIVWTVLWGAGWGAAYVWSSREADFIRSANLRYVEAVYVNGWLDNGIVDPVDYEAAVDRAHDRADFLRSIEEAALPWGLGLYLFSIVATAAGLWVRAGFKNT